MFQCSFSVIIIFKKNCDENLLVKSCDLLVKKMKHFMLKDQGRIHLIKLLYSTKQYYILKEQFSIFYYFTILFIHLMTKVY